LFRSAESRLLAAKDPAASQLSFDRYQLSSILDSFTLTTSRIGRDNEDTRSLILCHQVLEAYKSYIVVLLEEACLKKGMIFFS
jgi:hypothetical protein